VRNRLRPARIAALVVVLLAVSTGSLFTSQTAQCEGTCPRMKCRHTAECEVQGCVCFKSKRGGLGRCITSD
jgi:hypothetical protein